MDDSGGDLLAGNLEEDVVGHHEETSVAQAAGSGVR
jgi:hypothetical protein